MEKDILELKKELALLQKDFNYLKELTDLKFGNVSKANDLYVVEIARRLEMLNGEADKLNKMQTSYLPREVYEQNHKYVTNDIESIIEWKNKSQGRNSAIAAFISLVISLIFIFIDKLF